jgi:hypothetical protein
VVDGAGHRHAESSRPELPQRIATLERIAALIALDGPTFASRAEIERNEGDGIGLEELLRRAAGRRGTGRMASGRPAFLSSASARAAAA